MIRPPGEERPRERVLSEDELRAVWHALESEEVLMEALFRLRILTAQRGGEVATMRRPDLDLAGGWWTIPPEFSKNSLSHRVPLSPWVIEIIEKALASADDPIWVFPSAMKDGPIRAIWQAVSRIRRRSGIDFRPHDWRRTAASLMTGMAISRLVVAKILNHIDPGITAIYDRHAYDNEKRQALEAWSARVQKIVTGRKADDGKVVPLRPA
jgi:integrase